MTIGTIISIIALLVGLAYFALIRPKLRQRKAINDTREWLFKLMGIMDTTSSKSVNLDNKPNSYRVICDIREYWGYPPNQDQVMEEISSRNEIGCDWDYAVHIHEGSEQYLGPEQFESLRERFASIPGIDECIHGDREVFLVKTRTFDAEKIREAFWQEFLEAAKEVFEKQEKG